MTDRIDLDELAADRDEADEERVPGDWLWGDREPLEAGTTTDARGDDAVPDEPADPDPDPASAGPRSGSATDGPGADGRPGRPTPHVPSPTQGKPAGIPVEGGGAGGGRPAGSSAPDGPADGAQAEEPRDEDAAGPHGGDADDMTLAFTHAAATRLEAPGRAFAEAARWADWVGIVGDVDAPVINKFQRDHGVDVDFFSGTGTGPGERLAEIDERSMFFAERMVVVGVTARDEPVAERAGWEFVPLAEAAEEAGWTLSE